MPNQELKLNIARIKKSALHKTIVLMISFGVGISAGSAMAALYLKHPYDGTAMSEQVNTYYTADKGFVGPNINRNWAAINARDKKMLDLLRKRFMDKSFQYNSSAKHHNIGSR